MAGRLGVVMKEKKRDWAISAGFLGVLLTAYVINYRFGFLEILDFHIEKVKKAYPAYFGTYDRMGELTAWLKSKICSVSDGMDSIATITWIIR